MQAHAHTARAWQPPSYGIPTQILPATPYIHSTYFLSSTYILTSTYLHPATYICYTHLYRLYLHMCIHACIKYLYLYLYLCLYLYLHTYIQKTRSHPPTHRGGGNYRFNIFQSFSNQVLTIITFTYGCTLDKIQPSPPTGGGGDHISLCDNPPYTWSSGPSPSQQG